MTGGAAVSGVTTAAWIAGGAVGGAIGSLASQGAAIGFKLQDRIDWKGVGLAAISSAVNGGLSSISNNAVNAVKVANLARAAGIAGTKVSGLTMAVAQLAQSGWIGSAVRGAVASGLTQGIGVATRLQKEFDLAGVAAAGISGAFSGAAQLPGPLSGIAGGIVNVAARSLINGTSFGDNLMAALPDIIGQTIGFLVAEGVSGLVQRDPPKRNIEWGGFEEGETTEHGTNVPAEFVLEPGAVLQPPERINPQTGLPRAYTKSIDVIQLSPGGYAALNTETSIKQIVNFGMKTDAQVGYDRGLNFSGVAFGAYDLTTFTYDDGSMYRLISEHNGNRYFEFRGDSASISAFELRVDFGPIRPDFASPIEIETERLRRRGENEAIRAGIAALQLQSAGASWVARYALDKGSARGPAPNPAGLAFWLTTATVRELVNFKVPGAGRPAWEDTPYAGSGPVSMDNDTPEYPEARPAAPPREAEQISSDYASEGSSGAVIKRASAVHPNLSTRSDNARAIVMSLAAGMQNWQAHHKIPFEVIASLPVDVQLAIANSGWKLDSPGNLIALPYDDVTYISPPNLTILPQHRGPHPGYSAETAFQFTYLVNNFQNMTPQQIRMEMSRIENVMTIRLYDKTPGRPIYHPVVR